MSALAEEDVPRTIQSNKTEPLFDTQLEVASAWPATQLVGRGAPSVIPNYAQTTDFSQSQTEQPMSMRLLPDVQAGMIRPLSAEQALVAAASGTAIARAECGRAQW